MPPNTVKVDRSTKWGNPFKVDHAAVHPMSGEPILVEQRADAIALFQLYVDSSAGHKISQAAAKELRGKNLACWCKAGNTCHGDVLLRIANADIRSKRAA